MHQTICRKEKCMEKSLLDYAFDFVSSQKEPTPFSTIWEYVVAQAGLSEEEAKAKVSRFYTNLMLDGRFVTLGENLWDLRSSHTFDKVHIDMKDVYSDVEATDSDDAEEAEEEHEYNEVFEDPKDTDDDKIVDSEEETEEE